MGYLLVTGGCGYLGSHAVVHFSQKGWNIVVVDNFSNSSKGVQAQIQSLCKGNVFFYEGDVRNRDFLYSLFQTYSFDGVLHFAGLKSVNESIQQIDVYFDNNIRGTLVLLSVMKTFGVKRMVFSSSATVYDTSHVFETGYEENHSVGETKNPYGTTKYIIERILRDYACYHAFQIGVLRYFNPIGAHESGKIGENPKGRPNNLLPYVLKVAIGEYPMLPVYGNDYPTRDGTCIRDYIDVQDLIEGHEAMYEYLASYRGQGIYEIINLGTGKGTTVLEMIVLAERVIGKKIPYYIAPRREGDAPIVCCNPAKAQRILGWKAKRTIEESIKASWNFYSHTFHNICE